MNSEQRDEKFEKKFANLGGNASEALLQHRSV